MKTRNTVSPRFAVCVNNSEYPASLELQNFIGYCRTKRLSRMAICELSMKAAKTLSSGLFRGHQAPE